jgi:hypothetical protein
MPVTWAAIMPKRFIDDGRTIDAFSDLFLVRCPRCQHRARVMALEQPIPIAPELPMRRVTCSTCGYTRDWPADGTQVVGWTIHGPFDWYFDLPLWLQTPCCGRVLFAYNSDHLNHLEAFLSASLRNVDRRRNQSVASRLPKWMQLKHNRDAVLQGLTRLRSLLSRA